MHYSAFILLWCTQIGATTSILKCNSGNCLRAVVASAFTTRHGSADCSSFFRKTVTPATITITATQTAASTATVTVPYVSPATKKRDIALAIAPRQVTVVPSSVPAYASACSGTAGYSSACSCIGVTETTTTVAAPTTTSTTTVIATATVTICANPLPTFILEITNSNTSINGKDIDGTFGQLDTGDGPLVGFNGSPESQAVVLSLTASGELEIDQLGVIGFTNNPVGRPGLILFATPSNVFGIPVICSVAGGLLSCSNSGCDPQNGCQTGVYVLQICPGYAVTNDLWIGSVVGSGCVAASFNVIPLCTPPAI